MQKRVSFWVSMGLLLASGCAIAGGSADLPPPFVGHQAETTWSCTQLDRRISRLLPLTYGRTPALYSDAAQGAAIWAGAVIHPLAWGYVGFVTYQRELEKRQREDVARRIEHLRRLKAEKQCFEDI